MIDIAVTIAVLSLLLLTVHGLWRKERIKGEVSRKAYHIAAGTFAAFWPHYMTWTEIQILAGLLVLLIIIIRIFKLWPSVYEIDRKSFGELFVPLSMFVAALLQPSAALFSIAALHVGWADGLAAVIGTRFGKTNRYRIIGNTKSVAGTAAFIAVSFSILLGAILMVDRFGHVPLAVVVWLPILAAFIENISPYGADNFFVAVLLIVALQSFDSGLAY